MKILEEDFVDWEPLFMRFVAAGELPADRRHALGAFLEDWFRTNADAKRADCDIRFWNVDVGEMTATCEQLTRSSLRRLTKAVHRRFPDIDHVRIGIQFDGVPSGLGFRWTAFSEPAVEMDGRSHPLVPFAVSTFQVSFGQFREFLAGSGYQPDCDKAQYSGYLKSHMELNWGKNPKTPIFGVSYNDALAFCDWANVRLPTEPELHLFFATRASADIQPEWSGDCWTATASCGMVRTRQQCTCRSTTFDLTYPPNTMITRFPPFELQSRSKPDNELRAYGTSACDAAASRAAFGINVGPAVPFVHNQMLTRVCLRQQRR